MEKVLKVSEVSNGIEQLIKKKKHERQQLTHIKNALNNVVGLDDALKGEGGQAIRQNFSMVHMPVLEAFDQFLEQYIQQLKDIQNQVNSYESEDGLVREHFIEHDVNNGLDKIKSIVDDSVGDINHHFEKVSDIVSGSPISSDHLDSEIHKAKHDNQETVDQLNKLDHESKSGLEDSEDSLKQITQLVGKVKDWAKDGPFLTNLPKPVQAKLNKAYKDLQNGEIGTDEYFDILSNFEEEEKIENLDSDSKVVIKKAKEDYKNGNIDKSTYEAIVSGVIQTGTQFLKNAVSTKITNDVSEEIAKSIVQWTKNNTSFFVNRGLVAVPVTGNVTSIPEPPSMLSKSIRTGARFGGPIVGSAIDFGIQLSKGEDVEEAAIKTGGHLGAGMVGAAIGTAIPVPVLGTVVGFAVGVAGSMAFDWVYDHKDKIKKGITEGVKKVGDAVSGFFGKLGSVFG